ncbi:MAG: site-specific DNA-methyltransferase [Ruminococcaceae bacterium]|nr:site-specific DNA-methyltransferase [Oscillospiraceae bacterium]
MHDILDGMSMNLEQANMDKLRSVFPECFAEGKLDIDKLLALCGEYISNDFEKYKFEWKGKAECLKLAQKRSTGTLRPCPEESVNWDSTQNLYIEGDNLEVLKLLQTAYYRRVKMIYIDPPYNTGNDFVYADDFADPMARYKEVTQQTTKSNPETMGRFHTNWLNMMYPRLRLAANLLRDDGVIFISIDDNEVDNLKKLCNEVFGEENFVAQFIWERAFAPKNDAKYVSNSHDYVLMYAKALESFTIGQLSRSEETENRYKNPDNDPRGKWTSGDLSVKTYNANSDYEIITPSGRKVKPPHGACWRVSKQRFDELVADNRIWFGENGDNVPRLKRFLSEIKEGIVPTSILFHKDVGHSQEGRQELKRLFDDKGYFDGPKPVRLLRHLMTIANTDEDAILLDFFSGSATTAHAVMQLNAEDSGNRRFILVQLPEVCDEKSDAHKAGFQNICEIGKERIRRAGAKLVQEQAEKDKPTMDGQITLDDNSEFRIPNSELDIGFRVFKLDTSNLETWDGTPIVNEQIQILYDRMNSMVQRVKSDRTDLDMVFEVMLKLGVPLTYSVNQIAINSKTAYAVGDDCLLLICLAADVAPEDVEAMAEYAPAKVIISRDSFTDDTAMANAYYILRDRGIELKLL